MHEPLQLLHRWVEARLNGVWEHHNGLRISNTDNPGWLVEIQSDRDLVSQTEHLPLPAPSGRVEAVWAGDRILIHSRTLDACLEFAGAILVLLDGDRMSCATLCERLKSRR